MKPYRRHPEARGSSLIIVLVFAVLLTAVIVAFLSRNQIQVQSSRSSANGTRVDIFCQGAVETLLGDIKQEIVDGSTAITVGNSTVYLPLNATATRQNILPYPVNAGCTTLSLVKESLSGQPFYAGGTYSEAGVIRASSSPTTTTSSNGRSVSLARWNKPLLLTANSYSTPPDLTPAATVNFSAPDWVYVARNGTNPTSYAANMSDPTDNAHYVVGRYAYVIYDESSLLDMNVAGYPSTSKAMPAQIAAKGVIGLADLTQTGLAQTDIDAIVGWRNYATTGPTGSFPSYSSISANNYFYYLVGGTSATPIIPPPNPNTSPIWEGARRTGFLHPANAAVVQGQTDRLFGSRQELIRMLVHDIAGTDNSARARVQQALQYLGTFSRETNSPSWMPVKPTGSSIDYAHLALAQAQSPATSGAPANQIAPAVFATKSFLREDGTTANVGDPLMKYRFPLRRLEWFNLANQTKYAAGIQKCFGMKAHGDGTWDFVDPLTGAANPASGSGLPIILTLDQVAAAQREPTFWEVLQAAILSGSVGVGHLNGFEYPTSPGTDLYPVRHLVQIGLNIIDQYNSNATPTCVRLGNAETNRITNPGIQTPIAGVKNLPYIMGIAQQGFPETAQQTPAPTSYAFDIYKQFLLWNPHSNATATAAPNASFRLLMDGADQIIAGTGPPANTATVPPSTLLTYAPGYGTADTIAFQTKSTPSRLFDQIDVLTPSDLSPGTSANATYPLGQATGAHQVGMFLGKVQMPKYPSMSGVTEIVYPAVGLAGGEPFTYHLEVQDASGNWIPYQVIPDDTDKNLEDNYSPGYASITGYMNSTAQPNSNAFVSIFIATRADPRTIRLGDYPSIVQSVTPPSPQAANWNLALATGSALTPLTFTTSSAYAPIFSNSPPPTYPITWATLAFNTITAGQYYPAAHSAAPPVTDVLDGVVRRADGNATISYKQGNPYFDAATSNSTVSPARPFFLGRSFNSVAEMGYAFRDEPWKSLNFYSKDSADGALLDYFSLSESSIRAGGVNINTASVPVLTAMLMGSWTDTSDSNSNLSATGAAAIATAIRNYVGTTRQPSPANALYDPSDIPALSDAVTAISGTTGTGTIPDSNNLPGGLKRAQEVIARSFADTWNTRTWNLMFDVIAQTGRFPQTGATSLDNFVVEGERRVWVHVAIDRFTGNIVDMQTEPVSE